jgi:hypothetical protein
MQFTPEAANRVCPLAAELLVSGGVVAAAGGLTGGTGGTVAGSEPPQPVVATVMANRANSFERVQAGDLEL